jgi:hypothetical protein
VSSAPKFEKGNFRSAFLSLQTALRDRPDHLEARGLAASLLEASGSAEALVHRRRLMELQPQLLAPKLAFASCALRFGKPDEAAKVLDAIEGPDRERAEFRELEAELYLVNGRTDLALKAYRELLERYSENRRARVNLAVLELQGSPGQASARATLEAMASNSDFGLIALRALTQDALRRQDFSAALSSSGRALEMRLAEFSDKIGRLWALFGARSPEYSSWLSQLEKSASENPQFAFELAKWKVMAMGPQAAAAWLESLPKSVRDQLQIRVLLADCYSALKRWNDLEYLVRWSNWSELEPLRLAFLARAQAGQDNLQKSENTWQLAVAAAEKQPTQLAPLLTMARADKRDVRQILWMIAEKDPRQFPVQRELYETYRQEQDADGMLRVMELISKEHPSDRSQNITSRVCCLSPDTRSIAPGVWPRSFTSPIPNHWRTPPSMPSVCTCRVSPKRVPSFSIHGRICRSLATRVPVFLRSCFQLADGATKRATSSQGSTGTACYPSCEKRWIARWARLYRIP